MVILINVSSSKKRSRRDFSIDVVFDIIENNHSLPCFTFISKLGVSLPKTRLSFYCVIS